MDRDELRNEIAAIYGFTPEQVYNCLGPSYIDAEREAKVRNEAAKARILAHAEQIGDSLKGVRFDVSDLLSR